ncbi:MAG: tRNA pseudouridine(55) synthase TruB [Lachnospiraceae bacterium]|nr:tRNA pseudouridine(55) synthase TruB [Lachnospiraceae bacterium]
MKSGIINVYKEAGFTSFDVVAKLRGILGIKKIGHTGTLDPDATGVLPICIGKATKICDFLTDRDKTYKAVMRLGIVTDTQDMSGNILSEKEVDVSETGLLEAINSFVGDILQIPPMYSALKVNGQKLVDLARKGQVIERKPRPITIHEINVIDISLPFVTMEVSCSKGTYIRTLCNDIGEKLNCGAAMDSLVRVRAAGFEIDDALKLSEIESLRDQGTLEDYILGIDEALDEYPSVKALDKCSKILANGGSVLIEDTDYKTDIHLQIDDGQLVRMYMADGTFVGVYEKKETAFKPNKMFLEA